MRFHTAHPDETAHLAPKIVSEAARLQHNHAVIICLSGDLGAGKTTLVKGIAQELGILETITSPTFVILKKYHLPESSAYASQFTYLIHIDAYRLQGGADMQALGFIEMTQDPSSLIVIEWPERIKDALPNGIVNVIIEHVGMSERNILITIKE